VLFDNLTIYSEPPRFQASSKNGNAADQPRRNFNVSWMLPVTTLRTIDLGGKKNPGPLLSRLCAKERVFLS